MFGRKNHAIQRARGEIERLRQRLDEARGDLTAHEFNTRRALARADRAETLLAEARKELAAHREGKRPVAPVRECQHCKAMEERLANLQAVNEALDVRASGEPAA